MGRVWLATAAAFVAAVVADLLLGEPPGLVAGFGFGGCVLLVFATKALGAAGLQRPDTEATTPAASADDRPAGVT